jgi:hypothetical protein
MERTKKPQHDDADPQQRQQQQQHNNTAAAPAARAGTWRQVGALPTPDARLRLLIEQREILWQRLQKQQNHADSEVHQTRLTPVTEAPSIAPAATAAQAPSVAIQQLK